VRGEEGEAVQGGDEREQVDIAAGSRGYRTDAKSALRGEEKEEDRYEIGQSGRKMRFHFRLRKLHEIIHREKGRKRLTLIPGKSRRPFLGEVLFPTGENQRRGDASSAMAGECQLRGHSGCTREGKGHECSNLL